MRKMIVSAFAAAAVIGFAAAPASAAEGVNEVVVFSHEIAPLSVYEDPQGCHAMPVGAHQLNNRTDKTVTVYQDPLCLVPQMQVQPGYGTHVTPVTGSFSVG